MGETECVDTDAGGVCVTESYDDGYYYDSLVTGVTYENRNEAGDVMRTNVTGEGDDPGRFRFLEGQTVAFKLGATDLGEAAAGPRVTPFELAGLVVPESADEVGGCDVDGTLPEDEFRIVHNLAVLLPTFDKDGDPTAGIEISAEVAALFDEVSVEVDQPWADFQADTALEGVLNKANTQNLLSEVRTLREREEALRALYQGIGLCPDGTGGTGGTGGGAGGTGGGMGGMGGGTSL